MPDYTVPPTLVVMAGMPGTGKTALALAFGRALGWPVIDKDTLKSPMLAGGVPESLAGPASYSLMMEVGHDFFVRQGFSVILDSPGRQLVVLERAHDMLREARGALKVVHCIADRALRDQRLRERAALPSQWTADAGYTDDEERAMFAHLPADRLVLDTSRAFQECVDAGLAYLTS